MHDGGVAALSLQRFNPALPGLCIRGCSSVVEHLLAKERVESSNLFIRLFFGFSGGRAPAGADRAGH